jgi:GNAT superfamily N-acetyltransferase
MSIEIRLAKPTDRDAVTALLVAQLREHEIATPEAALERAVGDLLVRPNRGGVVVAGLAGRLVGIAGFSFGRPLEHAGRSIWLEELYVEPQHRGRGIGRTLLDTACRLAAEAGAVAVDLEVEEGHARAAHLYAREGFRPHRRSRWVRTLTPAAPRPEPEPGTRLAGGCFCGSVRYEIAQSTNDVSHCHCGICRRTTGAPFVTWATVPKSAFRFVSGTPRELRATTRAVRTFCASCGTALTFTETARPGSVDVTVGSLDDPARVVPAEHIFTSSRVPWLHLDDDLPYHAEANPAER